MFKNFWGHELLSSTQIYTRVAIDKLQEIHRKTHPAWQLPHQPKTMTDEEQEQY